MEPIDLPAMIYAGVRNVGPYNTVGPAFERIISWAAETGQMNQGTKVLGLSWDDPSRVPAERLRYDAAITVDSPVEIPDDIHIGALPAMTWAMTRHKGSYASMPETFHGLADAVNAAPNLVFVGLCGLEIYLNDPQDTAEADLLTDIGLPVVRVG